MINAILFMLALLILFCALPLVRSQSETSSNNCTGPVVTSSLRAIDNSYMIQYEIDRSCNQTVTIVGCHYAGECLVTEGQKCKEYAVVNSGDAGVCRQKICPMLAIDSEQYVLFSCQNTWQSEIITPVLPPDPIPQSDNNSGLTVGPILGIVLLSILVVLCCIGIWIRIKECCCQEVPIDIVEPDGAILGVLALEAVQSERRIASPNSRRRLTMSRQEILEQKAWSPLSQSPTNPAYVQDNCPICLSADPNAMLDCRHFFHKECIYQWLTRTYNCPICKGTDIIILQILCTKCKNQSYSCLVQHLRSTFASGDICENCLTSSSN